MDLSLSLFATKRRLQIASQVLLSRWLSKAFDVLGHGKLE
jgi:hypothetical protein